MTIRIINDNGLMEQFVPSDVLFIASMKGKEIAKWDMTNVFVGFDMDSLRAQKNYLAVELRNGERHVYDGDDCIAVMWRD